MAATDGFRLSVRNIVLDKASVKGDDGDRAG